MLVAIFDPATCVFGKIGCKLAIRGDSTNQFGALSIFESSLFLQEDFVVDFTEGRCLVDQPSPILDRHEIGWNDAPGLVVDFSRAKLSRSVAQLIVIRIKWRTVSLANQLVSLALSLDLQVMIHFFRDGFDERSSNDQPGVIVAVVYDRILQIGMDRHELIAR